MPSNDAQGFRAENGLLDLGHGVEVEIGGDGATAVGDAGHHHGVLQGRGGHASLADGDVDGVAGVPVAVPLFLLREEALLPLFGWHEPGDFSGQVDAGADAEAHLVGPLDDLVDAELEADVVEEDVAGDGEGVFNVDGAMAGMLVAAPGAADLPLILKLPGQ
jgi:hypothetical protein